MGLAWNTVNNLTTRGISFLLGIFLARLLTPGDYGLIAMIGVFTAILSVFIDSGMSNALIRKQNRTETDLSTVFYFNLAVSCLIYMAMFISAPLIADFLRNATTYTAYSRTYNRNCYWCFWRYSRGSDEH